ncbi:MAG: cobalamin-dependent protein, partial [Alphaproteobacteria bacterium]
MTPSTSIAAVAGLVPPQIDVTLCNEPTQQIDYETDADVIGITANVAQAERALDIADRFKSLGKTVVFGGPHVSLAPDVFAGNGDSMVVGELESVAEAFFADMAAGAL